MRPLHYHRAWPVGLLQLIGLGIVESFFGLVRGHDFADPVAIVVHADPDCVGLVDDVSHIAVIEASVVPTFGLAGHEHLFLLVDNSDLLVVVEN